VRPGDVNDALRRHRSFAGRLVGFCADQAWLIVLAAVLLGAVAADYSLGHFVVSTDTQDLLSPKLAWRIREAALNRAFPPARSQIVVVVDGQTPELSEAAAGALADALRNQQALFHAVRQPDAGAFWAHNGLLYASTADVRKATAELIKAEPLLGPLAADPSLRGLTGTLSTVLQGVGSGQGALRDLQAPMRQLADVLERQRTGQPAFFSWRTLITGGTADTRELRHLILIDPNLDFASLEPGRAPSEAIRAAARTLGLDARHGVRVRLTGTVPLQDEEFATLAERALLIAVLAVGAIVAMLWLAVRSARLIAAILFTTLLGLVVAAALGLAVFHRFNVISVAFIPMFVGLGIDFGIQFSVRYRAEREDVSELRSGIVAAGRGMGRSLTLAAIAIAVGFLAFAPTDYDGVSQLGVVAGLGMLIALLLNLTVLPALIRLTRSPGLPERGPHARQSHFDDFVLRHRLWMIGGGVALAAASATLLPGLHFDFNPMHLRSPASESVATLYELMRDPDRSPNTLEAIRPDLAAAAQLADRVRTLPEVGNARTLASFVPADQPEKLASIADAANLLELALNPLGVAPPPSDTEVVSSLKQAARDLRQAASAATGASAAAAADARRLADQLGALADAGLGARAQATALLIPGLNRVLDQVRDSLQPQPVSLRTLPPDLTRDWMTPDGRARVSITPRGNADSNAVLSQFVSAVSRVIPDVTGTLLGIQEGGHVVVGAFIEAGVLSFAAITVLLLIALRRVRDVAITMAPIVLTGLLTLGSCVVIGQPLNFANIIALPLLFGIGVAFHIYFVMSWRSGGSHLLASSLARAIFFSALTTATGFGSLWASSHPGTASMGKLLMISLVWTLVSALLFQPALMGAPPAQTVPAD
jgi:hopanoid biosynthesis associated RND transporter like protein HpnN